MKVSSGTDALDGLLQGGFEKDTITVIYGPAGSGKTNICLHTAITVGKQKKVIYIDTEGGFSATRLGQLRGYEKSIGDNILFLRPTTFNAQKAAFEKLKDMVDETIGVIIVDTIAMLYRLAIGKSDHVYQLNKELGHQIQFLAEIARKKNIPVVMTNQVYASMENDSVVMVGGDLLKYQSKCIIELQSGHRGMRVAVLKKHRSIPEDSFVKFRIEEKGIKKME